MDDLELGLCLRKAGVTINSTRDEHGREHFGLFTLHKHYFTLVCAVPPPFPPADLTTAVFPGVLFALVNLAIARAVAASEVRRPGRHDCVCVARGASLVLDTERHAEFVRQRSRGPSHQRARCGLGHRASMRQHNFECYFSRLS